MPLSHLTLMAIDREEAAQALDFSNRRVLPHTDCVLVVLADGRARMASCVLLEVDGRKVAVTCAHVLRPDAKYFIGPNRLEQDRVPDDPGPPVRAARMLGRNEEADLALFDIPEDDPQRRGKLSYHLHHAEPITEARVVAQLKTAAFICGIFGNASRALQYPDGLVYTQLPFYATIGPLESCTSTQIIADFAEKALLHKADDVFPQLRDVQPTNGVRELGGISGSGLWVKSGEEMYLAGIALGRADSAEDQHLVRVTPVWVLRWWVRVLLSGRAGS